MQNDNKNLDDEKDVQMVFSEEKGWHLVETSTNSNTCESKKEEKSLMQETTVEKESESPKEDLERKIPRQIWKKIKFPSHFKQAFKIMSLFTDMTVQKNIENIAQIVSASPSDISLSIPTPDGRLQSIAMVEDKDLSFYYKSLKDTEYIEVTLTEQSFQKCFDRQSSEKRFSAAMWEKPDLEGEFKVKKMSRLLGWQKRWLVLQYNKIFYFKSDTKISGDTKPLGTIHLTRCKIQKKKDKNTTYLKIEEQGSIIPIYISASDEVIVTWENAIEKVQPYNMRASSVITENPDLDSIIDELRGVIKLEDPYDKYDAESMDNIGRGGSSYGIFRAREKETSKEVVIKIVSTADDNTQLALQEVSTHMKISGHKNIVTLYESYLISEDEQLWIIMEYMEQGSLTHLLKKLKKKKKTAFPKPTEVNLNEIQRKGNFVSDWLQEHSMEKYIDQFALKGFTDRFVIKNMGESDLDDLEVSPEDKPKILKAIEEISFDDDILSEKKIAYISREVLHGLKHLHDQNWIHRDIKSDNILLGKNGEIKLADFGFSVQLEKDTEKKTNLVGTTYWLAPEIIEGYPYGKEVDIWSLGVTIYELVEGIPMYWKRKPEKAIELIAKKGAQLKFHDQWSEDLKDFLTKCLFYDPKQRWNVDQLLSHSFIKSAQKVDIFS